MTLQLVNPVGPLSPPLVRILVSAVGRCGWRPSRLCEDVQLLEAVSEQLSLETADELLDFLLRVEPLVAKGLGKLGDNPRSVAAAHAIGFSPLTRGRLRKHRRHAAALAMHLAIDTFSKLHEREILDDLVAGMLAAQLDHDITGD